MKHVLGLGVLASFLVAAPAWAGSVKIISPKDGATVGSSVEMKVDVQKGDGVDHFHLFVDGEMVEPVMGDSVMVRGLSPGTHRLKAWASTSSHHLLDVSDEVKVTVR